MAEEKYIELTDTYKHFNTLIWQVLSWGIAIATAAVVAANAIGEQKEVWTISGRFVQSLILYFGAFLLFALDVALARYRDYQACSNKSSPPQVVLSDGPLGTKPRANLWLQGVMSMTTGGLFGLAIAQLFCIPWFIVIGLVGGIVLWRWLESGRNVVLNDIKTWRTEG